MRQITMFTPSVDREIKNPLFTDRSKLTWRKQSARFAPGVDAEITTSLLSDGTHSAMEDTDYYIYSWYWRWNTKPTLCKWNTHYQAGHGLLNSLQKIQDHGWMTWMTTFTPVVKAGKTIWLLTDRTHSAMEDTHYYIHSWCRCWNNNPTHYRHKTHCQGGNWLLRSLLVWTL